MKYSLLPGILESGALHLVFEVEGVGVVGKAFFQAFEHGFVEFETVFGVDERTVVERFVEGDEGGERAEVVLDEVDYVVLLVGKGGEVKGVGQLPCGGVFGFGNGAFAEELLVLLVGSNDVAKDLTAMIGVVLQLP